MIGMVIPLEENNERLDVLLELMDTAVQGELCSDAINACFMVLHQLIKNLQPQDALSVISSALDHFEKLTKDIQKELKNESTSRKLKTRATVHRRQS